MKISNVIHTLAAKVANAIGSVPTQPGRPPSPRSDPVNLAATAKASDLASATRAAEQGDTKNLFTLYRDSVLSDDHVQSCLNTRKLALLGQPLTVMAFNKNNPDDVTAAKACNRAVLDCENWIDGLGAILDSAFWPVSAVEKLFRQADPPADDEPKLQYTLRRLEPVTPHLFCFKWAYQAGAKIDPEKWEPLLKLWPLDAEGKILSDITKAEYLDPTRYLVHRGHLLTGFRDNWGGPGRAILGWWLLRGLGRDWFGRFMERYGQPFLKAKTDKADPQAVAFLQEAFALTTKISGIVIDHEDEVELEQALVQGGAEGHKLWHEVCNNAISRAITGYDANSSPAGLNAGESQHSENVREDVRQFDQIKCVATLQRQLFGQLLKINGLTGRIKLAFGGLSDEDAGQFATTLKTMSEAGFEPTDEAIPTINERLGLPVQRKQAVPAPTFGTPVETPPGKGSGQKPPSPGGEGRGEVEPRTNKAVRDVQTFSSRDLRGRLVAFSAGGTPPAKDPTAAVASSNADELGAALEESFGPLVKIIEGSTSKADAEAKIRAYFADWRPNAMVAALEKPLQICAAQGAVEGKA